MADYSKEQRQQMAKKGEAMPDSKSGGKFPIANRSDLRNALDDYNRIPAGEKPAVKRHIISRARKLGLVSMLPDDWGVKAEDAIGWDSLVALEFDPAKAVKPPAADDDGIMRMEVPFYIGNSIAQPSNWDQPLFFSAEALPGLLMSAEKQIAEGKLPLSVYARHQHARAADHLPIGRVAGVRAEGNTGYALLEVLDDGHFGTQTQKLVRAGMLNSVSLRSKKGIKLEEAKVNGEEMLAAVGMEIAGIDFAPEGPAMPTYGVRVLAEANVEPVSLSSEQDDDTTPEEESPDMEITLEAVRARADIVSEIQKPVLAERDTVSKERDSLKAERDAAVARAEKAEGRVVELEAAEVKRGVDEVVAKAVARCPEKGREAAKTVFAEAVKDAKTVAEAKAAVFDLMLEAGINPTEEPKADDSKKTPAQILAESFGRPVGKTDVGGEDKDEVDAEEGEVEMAGALPIPSF